MLREIGASCMPLPALAACVRVRQHILRQKHLRRHITKNRGNSVQLHTAMPIVHGKEDIGLRVITLGVQIQLHSMGVFHGYENTPVKVSRCPDPTSYKDLGKSV